MSVQSPNVRSSSLDYMYRITTAVQQIMTEVNGDVSKEEIW